MNWFSQSINGLILLLLPVAHFLFFATKQNIYDASKDTNSFTELGKNLLNGYFL